MDEAARRRADRWASEAWYCVAFAVPYAVCSCAIGALVHLAAAVVCIALAAKNEVVEDE